VALRWRSTADALEIPIATTERVYLAGRVADARCVLYLIRPDGTLAGSGGPLIMQTDSLRVRAHLTNCMAHGASPGDASLRPDSASVSLLLAAYDSAYAAHVVRPGGRGVRESRASPGLTGAYGVFGSVATARRRVVLVSSLGQ
jgi:hypothetical protein